MIGFSGPVTITTAHARLLYFKHEDPKTLWSQWPKYLKKCDQIIEEHPRIDYAHSQMCLYFFGPEAKECWAGREIIGHMAKAPEGGGLFDSFSGLAFEWEMNPQDIAKLRDEDLLLQAEKLKGLAGGSLASTWRVVIQPMEANEGESGPLKLGRVTFQFYKMG